MDMETNKRLMFRD